MGVIIAYIRKQPQEQQPQLMDLYDLLKQTLPDAEERISYGMPAFFQSKPLIYFGASKHHIGIYPTNEGISHFASELSDYVTTKGSWHISYDEPLPEQLIIQMAQHRLAVIQRSE